MGFTAFYENYFWEGRQVRLRAPRKADIARKLKEYTDSEARMLLQTAVELPPVSLERFAKQFEDMIDFKDTSRYTHFSVETLAGEYVGWVNLFISSHQHGTFSFSVSIYREYQRKGYAEDAVRILLRYGFHELRMQKCNSGCLAFNEGSIRLHEKLGFKQEACIRRNYYIHGQYHDDLLWGVLREEFEENDAKYLQNEG
jgi:RimJ/RimL family protein N-acetyltransferase